MWRIVEPLISLCVWLALLLGAGYLLLHTRPGLALCYWLVIGTSILTGIAILGAVIAATTASDTS